MQGSRLRLHMDLLDAYARNSQEICSTKTKRKARPVVAASGPLSFHISARLGKCVLVLYTIHTDNHGAYDKKVGMHRRSILA